MRYFPISFLRRDLSGPHAQLDQNNTRIIQYGATLSNITLLVPTKNLMYLDSDSAIKHDLNPKLHEVLACQSQK